MPFAWAASSATRSPDAAAHHQVAREVADAHPAVRLLARRGAEDGPLRRREPLLSTLADAGIVQHIVSLTEPEEPPVDEFDLRRDIRDMGVSPYARGASTRLRQSARGANMSQYIDISNAPRRLFDHPAGPGNRHRKHP